MSTPFVIPAGRMLRTECIEHTQKGNHKGYGATTFKGKGHNLHRVVYCKHHGIEPANIRGLHVRHKCDNARCINPEHLEIGTRDQNMNDMRVRNRAAKGEKNGNSKLTADLVRAIRAEYVRGSSTYGLKYLSKKYGVSLSALSPILRGKSWTCV